MDTLSGCALTLPPPSPSSSSPGTASGGLPVEEVSELRHREWPLREAVWHCCQAGAVSVPTVLLFVKENTQEIGAEGFRVILLF